MLIRARDLVNATVFVKNDNILLCFFGLQQKMNNNQNKRPAETKKKSIPNRIFVSCSLKFRFITISIDSFQRLRRLNKYSIECTEFQIKLQINRHI